jgi:hypothetical protein
MALQFVTQPQSVLVDQSASSVTFSTSAIDPLSGNAVVSYQWRVRDVDGTTYSNVAGATSRTLTLAPIAGFDNDNFIVIARTTLESLTSVEATFAIRLSGDRFSPWEVNTFESGQNRVRRLQALGYIG